MALNRVSHIIVELVCICHIAFTHFTECTTSFEGARIYEPFGLQDGRGNSRLPSQSWVESRALSSLMGKDCTWRSETCISCDSERLLQVHPSVPSILFTPICPHSLSFRPLVFPDHVQLRVQVPENVRNSEMHCSFDGSDHITLRPGDALVVQLSKHPVPTVCDANVSHDWFSSVREGLYWNLRKMQGVHDGKPHVDIRPA